jgi:hypothetical protein
MKSQHLPVMKNIRCIAPGPLIVKTRTNAYEVHRTGTAAISHLTILLAKLNFKMEFSV